MAMAMQLGGLHVSAKLCCGNVQASEKYYYITTCYMKFRNRCRSLKQQEKNASKERETILLDVMHGGWYPIWYMTSQSFLLLSVTLG